MSWADKFNLLDPIVDLRLICGLFFIPHIVGKFTEPATLNFFKAAKFNPPATWMYIAGAIETVLTIALVFAIYTPYVAVIAAFHLFVAGAATYKVTKKWIWVIGGIEYCVFWMLCCVVLAMLTWPIHMQYRGSKHDQSRYRRTGLLGQDDGGVVPTAAT